MCYFHPKLNKLLTVPVWSTLKEKKKKKLKYASLDLNINIDSALASFSTGLECRGVCKIFHPIPQVGLLSSVQQVRAALGKLVQDPIIP